MLLSTWCELVFRASDTCILILILSFLQENQTSVSPISWLNFIRTWDLENQIFYARKESLMEILPLPLKVKCSPWQDLANGAWYFRQKLWEQLWDLSCCLPPHCIIHEARVESEPPEPGSMSDYEKQRPLITDVGMWYTLKTSVRWDFRVVSIECKMTGSHVLNNLFTLSESQFLYFKREKVISTSGFVCFW